MKHHRLAYAAAAALLVLGAAVRGAAAPTNSPAGVEELRKQFEATIREVQRQAMEAAKVNRQRYTAGLVALEEALQASGSQLSAMLAVRAERTRFEQSGDIPASALSENLPAVRKLQDNWRALTAASPRDQAQKIVAASERYLQSLALLQKELAARHDAPGVEEVKAEKERLLGNNRVREALALLQTAAPPPANPPPSTPVKPPEPPPVAAAPAVLELGGYKFYPPGKEPPKKDLRFQHMEFPSSDQRSAQFFYDLRVSVTSDKSDVSVTHSSTYYSVSRTKSGSIATIPRITLSSKNRELPEGCKMVIEYFSQPPGRANDLRREKVEHIPLPPLARTRSYTVDGKGISLYKSESSSTYSGRSGWGREFYGLIISVFDAKNILLYQQCTPSAVAVQCGTKPVEATKTWSNE